MKGIRVALFGGTGRVGGGIYQSLIADSRVEEIYFVTRQSTLSHSHDKVRIIQQQAFLDPQDYAQVPKVECVVWTLGGPPFPFIMTKERYEKEQIQYPCAAARYFGEAGAIFHHISGAGAEIDKWPYFCHVKAVAEREIASIIPTVSYRPRKVNPADDSWDAWASSILPYSFAVPSTLLGKAILHTHFHPPHPAIVEHLDIVKAALQEV